MRERRQIMQLAAQLQQLGPFQATTLANFITKNDLSPEEVAMLQGEVISNVVSLFSVQQATSNLTQRAKQLRPAQPVQRVPTLADLPVDLGYKALTRPVYQASDPVPYYCVNPKASRAQERNQFKKEGSEEVVKLEYNRLYAFPYDPMAAGRAQPGRAVRYYYPGEGLELTGVEQIAFIDEQTGVLQLSNGKLIPASYVTGIVGKNE